MHALSVARAPQRAIRNIDVTRGLCLFHRILVAFANSALDEAVRKAAEQHQLGEKCLRTLQKFLHSLKRKMSN